MIDFHTEENVVCKSLWSLLFDIYVVYVNWIRSQRIHQRLFKKYSFCSNDIGVSSKNQRIVADCPLPLSHHIPPAFHYISITLPFWCRSFYHHFMCQDNFSRYSIFFSFFKFNFNFGITYLFVRDGIEQAPFSPSIDIYIYSHRKKAEKYIKLKNSHVEITRTIWFEYGIMFVPMPGLTCANSFEITQRRGKKKQLNDNSCVHVYVWVPFVYGWSFIAQIRAIMIMTTILINRRRTIW